MPPFPCARHAGSYGSCRELHVNAPARSLRGRRCFYGRRGVSFPGAPTCHFTSCFACLSQSACASRVWCVLRRRRNRCSTSSVRYQGPVLPSTSPWTPSSPALCAGQVKAWTQYCHLFSPVERALMRVSAEGDNPAAPHCVYGAAGHGNWPHLPRRLGALLTSVHLTPDTP